LPEIGTVTVAVRREALESQGERSKPCKSTIMRGMAVETMI
jgi:hypothetical protein